MKLSINNFFVSCIILLSSMANALAEDAPKSNPWYKTPLLSQTLDLPGQDATDTKQPDEIPQIEVTQVPPVADAPSIQAPQPVTPAESNPVNLPPKREVKLPKSNLKAISASEVRRGSKSGEVRLEPSSAPAFPTRVSTEQPEKPWYRKFYVRADYGYDPARTKPVYLYNDIYVSKFKANPVVGGGVGYRFNNCLRSDVTVQHRHITSKSRGKLKVSQNSIMFNAYFDLIDVGFITPYLTVGGGYVSNSVKGLAIQPGGDTLKITSKRYNSFGYDFGAGVVLNIFRDIVKLDLSYKYLNLGKFKSRYDITVMGIAGKSSPLVGKIKLQEFTGGVIVNL